MTRSPCEVTLQRTPLPLPPDPRLVHSLAGFQCPLCTPFPHCWTGKFAWLHIPHQKFVFLSLGSANLFCKKANGDYFWLCGPFGLHCNYWTVSLLCESSLRQYVNYGCGHIWSKCCSMLLPALAHWSVEQEKLYPGGVLKELHPRGLIHT